MKGLSNKYGENGENHKSNNILHLEREKVKKGIGKSANFAKVKRLFLLWEGPRTPVHQCFFLMLMVILTGIRSFPVIM